MKPTALLLTLLPLFSLRAAETDSLPSHPIEEVVVKGYKFELPLRDAPNKVEVISARDILHTPAVHLSDLIKKSTAAESVDMQGMTGGIEFRGFSPGGAGTNTYSVLLLDGVPMGTKNAAATFLSGLESVEIMKGPFSALYGSGAMGGVVNLVTKQSRNCISGSASAGYGSYNTLELSAHAGGWLAHRLDFDLSFDYHRQHDDYKTGHNDLFRRTPYEKEVLDRNSYGMVYPNTGFDKKQGVLRVGYDLHRGWRLNLYNNLFHAGHARGNGTIWGLYDQTDKRVLRNYHRLDITGNAGNHSLRISPYFGNETSDYLNSGYEKTRSHYAYRTFGLVAQDAFRFRTGRLVFGIDNFSQRYVSTQSREDGTPTAPYQPDYYNIQTGAFAQLHLRLFRDRLIAQTGIRYDNTWFRTTATRLIDMKSSGKSYHSVNPTLALKYRPVPLLGLHSSIGRGFMAPEAFKTTGRYALEYVWNGSVSRTEYRGNPDLKPESSLTVDAGIGATTRDGSLQADVTWFLTDHRNMIVTEAAEDFAFYTYVNSSKSAVRGLEFLLSYDLGKSLGRDFSLKFYGNYTRIYHSSMTASDGETPIKYLSPNTAAFGADFTSRRFAARIGGRYLGHRIEDNFLYMTGPNYENVPFVTASGIEVRPTLVGDRTITLPDFMVFDCYLSYMPARNLTVAAEINNLLGENYMERDGYYMPGRNFMIRLSCRF